MDWEEFDMEGRQELMSKVALLLRDMHDMSIMHLSSMSTEELETIQQVLGRFFTYPVFKDVEDLLSGQSLQGTLH